MYHNNMNVSCVVLNFADIILYNNIYSVNLAIGVKMMLIVTLVLVAGLSQSTAA